MERKLQKIGNSRGIILDRTMREHIGVMDSDQVEVTLADNTIVIRASRRQSFEDAMAATFNQYDGTLKRLAE